MECNTVTGLGIRTSLGRGHYSIYDKDFSGKRRLNSLHGNPQKADKINSQGFLYKISWSILHSAVYKMFLINSWWMICIENKITIKYFSRCWTAFWVVHLCPNGVLLSTMKASAFLELHSRAFPFSSSAGSGCPRSTTPCSTWWHLCSCALHGTSYRVSI